MKFIIDKKELTNKACFDYGKDEKIGLKDQPGVEERDLDLETLLDQMNIFIR